MPINSRSQPGTGKKNSSWPILFWLGFFILLLGIFLINREAIINSVRAIQNEIAGRSSPGMDLPPIEPNTDTEVRVSPPPATSVPAAPPRQAPEPSSQQSAPPTQAPAGSVTPSSSAPPASQGQPSAPPITPPVSQTPSATQQTTTPAAPPASAPANQVLAPAANQSQAGQVEMRDRALYFIHVDRGGSILREKVTRKIPVSDSPMIDAIGALISGPNGEEKGKGLISLIPPTVRILSATVRGDTAYISFSEDFQYNTYGVEGYAAQLRQIVFTATEFPNVANVQILIEGRRIDYLGEGIWIGSPLNRDML